MGRASQGLATRASLSLRGDKMSEAQAQRRPFVEPVVSEPTDALEATRTFGGLLQALIAGGSSGTSLDDGDCFYGDICDPFNQDGPYGDSTNF